jgi:hypothetical protein
MPNELNITFIALGYVQNMLKVTTIKQRYENDDCFKVKIVAHFFKTLSNVL